MNRAQRKPSSFEIAVEASVVLDTAVAKNPSAYRVLTGERPTGRLHVGHYFGTLANRLHLQELGVELYVLIADYQVLTDRDSTTQIKSNVYDFLADYVAIGLDPGRTTIFAHSYVSALNQLLVPFLGLVGVPELERNPTVKDEIKQAGRDTVSSLMFTYPVHQAADILSVRANLVPVGKDQLPHIELAREIARRFNARHGELFPFPQALLSGAPLLLGTDGRKMGKSLNNSVAISASSDETSVLIAKAKTDSERHVTYEPERRPELANLLLLGSLCLGESPEELAESIGDRGSKVLKAVVTEAVNEFFRPIRTRRGEIVKDPGYLAEILRTGNEKVALEAERTYSAVRTAMDMDYY